MNTVHKQLKTPPIHYYISEENNAPCIIFVHPAFADHRAFDEQLKQFSRKYKMITIDLLGHGQSQNISTKDGIDYSSVHMKAIMDIEGVDKAHLVGVSVGSLIVQDFANRWPDMVMSLCSLGGYDINNYDKSFEAQQRKQQMSFMVKALFSINSFSRANSLVSAVTKEAQSNFYEMNRLFKRRSFKYMTTLNRIMNRHTTGIRAYPLLILCGDQDIPLSIALSEKWNAYEQHSSFHLITNAGHCANMDNPIEFNAILWDFITSVEGVQI
jgi:pimeloyl-ACP methyl ester carboxylesterase